MWFIIHCVHGVVYSLKHKSFAYFNNTIEMIYSDVPLGKQ